MAHEKTTECGDFFTSLMQDHARIEARLKALVQAAGALSKAESDAAAPGVITETLDFFATEGARHEDIEELTLFPRLRFLPAFKQIISALEVQHRMNRVAHEELQACVDRFSPESRQELRRLAIRFVEFHQAHAIAEERALFPLAASALSPREVADMGREALERKHGVSSTQRRG